ncbi:hypothetical protein U1Q18_051398 [Sarracenia purpurea var. burkii]
MNSSRFFIFYISLFCSHFLANVQSQKEKALVLDLEKDKLIEIDEEHETPKCNHCITACAASPDSNEEQQIEKDASIDGKAVFLQEVYNNEDETRKIETDICRKPLNPAIVWYESKKEFEIGYEMFYNEKRVMLPSWFYGISCEKLWPDQIRIGYMVQGEIEVDSDAFASENQLIRKSPVPEIICRIVEWRHESYEYKAVVVIHNGLKPLQDEDKICPYPINSWNVMNESTNTAVGQSYTCPFSEDVISKLKLDEEPTANDLDLKNFPHIVNILKTPIYHYDVTQKFVMNLIVTKNSSEGSF